VSELRFVGLCALLLAAAVTSCANDLPAAPEARVGGEGAVDGAPPLDALVSPPLEGRMISAPPPGTAGIPVLVFHAICEGACATTELYGITKDEFARMLRSLKAAGYQTISMADFVRAHGGQVSGLPGRPILITFDDGRLDAYRGADDVLREMGFEATMFVMTVEGDRSPTFRMQWAQIREAAASGRWTIQLHAHAGHVQVPVAIDADGVTKTGAFYGWRQCDPSVPACGSLESFDDWRARVERDLAIGDSLLTAKLGTELYTSLSFAVPFSDYGQNHSNDARIAAELRALLNAEFAVWFTQPSADPPFMKPAAATHEVGRYLVLNTTTTEDVDAWLARHAAP